MTDASSSAEAPALGFGPPAQPGPSVGASSARILVIDDATVVRLYYRQILESEGYRIEEAINGIEGLEILARQSFDLCIVDVNMPVMDGYAFIRALRREPLTHAIPTLMASTEAGPQDRQAALQAGANFYLVKPVPRARLALCVAALLGHGVR